MLGSALIQRDYEVVLGCTVTRTIMESARGNAVRKKRTKVGSAEAVDELAWCENLDAELLGVDCVQVGIAGDDRVRVAGGRERDQVVVVGVAAHGGGRPRRIGEQDGLGGEVSDESQRLIY
jgi:hypothetical protein